MLRAVLVAAGMAAVASSAARADDLFPEKSKDFGPTPRGPVLVHYFYVKNTTGQTLNLGQARVSCGCVSATVLNYSLAPGELTAVKAQMDTRRIPRSYQPWPVTVFVPVYGAKPYEATMVVQATAREDLQMTDYSFAFGTVPAGKGATRTTKVTFQSDPNWEVKDVTSNGTHVKAAAKLVARNGNDVTYEVTANLQPDCPPGNWTAEVFLNSNTRGLEKIRIPVTVDVPAAISATTDAAANASVKVGETATREIVLKSDDPFKVLAVKGSDDSVLLQTSATDSQEAKEHRLSVKVSANKPGPLARTFEITTDHKAQPKVEVEFKATAVNK